MTGFIVDFFGYAADDKSKKSQEAAKKKICPFMNRTCSKKIDKKDPCGVCGVQTVKMERLVIICPERLYADNYRILRIIAKKAFKVELSLPCF